MKSWISSRFIELWQFLKQYWKIILLYSLFCQCLERLILSTERALLLIVDPQTFSSLSSSLSLSLSLSLSISISISISLDKFQKIVEIILWPLANVLSNRAKKNPRNYPFNNLSPEKFVGRRSWKLEILTSRSTVFGDVW